MIEIGPVTWSCTQGENFYLLKCQRGEIELFEIIERQRWARAIDRVMIFKRAIEAMSRMMHAVISAGIE
jgi:hypothetical protein